MDRSSANDINNKTEKLVAINFVVEEGDCGILTTTRYVPEPVARKYEQDRVNLAKERREKAELAKKQELDKAELIQQREIQMSKGMGIFELVKLIIKENKPITQQIAVYKKYNFLAKLVEEKKSLNEERKQLLESLRTAGGAMETCICPNCRKLYSNITTDKIYAEIDDIDKRLSNIQQELNG